MTRNRDFKTLVRARMLKTGESYTAARAQLEAPPAGPTPDEYADIAGISDEALHAKTGRAWEAWVDVLDAAGAATLSHKEIVAILADRHEVDAWWRQGITVGYERIRGLRAKGQLCTGDFAASKSKTFPVPVERLFEAFGDTRDAWIGTPTELRTSTPHRSVRLTWPDGTVISAWFTDKGPEKSAVAIQHEKLASAARRDREKQEWADRLSRLAVQLRIRG